MTYTSNKRNNHPCHSPKSRREKNEAGQSRELVRNSVIYNSHLKTLDPITAVLQIPAIQATNPTISFSTTIYDAISPPQKLLHSLLQACYQLDITICASTQSSLEEIMSWQSLDLLSYLSSPILLSRWESDLELLCQQYLKGTFTPDIFERKLATILPGVEQLTNARERLTTELENELEKMWSSYQSAGNVLGSD